MNYAFFHHQRPWVTAVLHVQPYITKTLRNRLNLSYARAANSSTQECAYTSFVVDFELPQKAITKGVVYLQVIEIDA